MEKSLYERVGGEAALMAAVDLFYAKVLANDLLRPFFEQLDMESQIRKQISFMSWALGGPESYKGRDLTTAHAHLVKAKGLGDIHFDAVAVELCASRAQSLRDPEAFKCLHFELWERDRDRRFVPVDPIPHLASWKLVEHHDAFTPAPPSARSEAA